MLSFQLVLACGELLLESWKGHLKVLHVPLCHFHLDKHATVTYWWTCRGHNRQLPHSRLEILDLKITVPFTFFRLWPSARFEKHGLDHRIFDVLTLRILDLTFDFSPALVLLRANHHRTSDRN